METTSSTIVAHRITLLSTGLLFLAAIDDHAEAFMMLARRYEHQFGGLEKDLEVASIYAHRASGVTSDAYHKLGGQPVIEVI
jgi:hypothetical protein